MMESHTLDRLKRLITQSLYPVPNELNELDWKTTLLNNSERLKEHISAFANQHGGGFFIFGIDALGQLQGMPQTDVMVTVDKLSNLAREGVQPPVQIQHAVIQYEEVTLLGIWIPESSEKPVRKKGKSIEYSYIRSGGQTRKMSDQELRIALMTSRSLRFEEMQGIVPKDWPRDLKDPLHELFDFRNVYTRLKFLKNSLVEEYDFLQAQKLVIKSSDKLMPTNLAILCCAKDFSGFPSYEKYQIRVIQYRGTNKLAAQKDQFFCQGYSLCLDAIVQYIISLIPYHETIKNASRVETPVIPEIALREGIVNAVIHRDYSKTDAYITVEVFDDRIEITNPGGLLPEISVDRLIGYPSRTRNEVLADFMRKLNFCEERGSGMLKIAYAMEIHGLPAVEFTNHSDFFKVTFFQPKEFSKLEKHERINAVYQHACLNKFIGRKTTNTTVRERFGFSSKQVVKATRLLNDALESGRIKIANPEAPPREVHYLPYWA